MSRDTLTKRSFYSVEAFLRKRFEPKILFSLYRPIGTSSKQLKHYGWRYKRTHRNQSGNTLCNSQQWTTITPVCSNLYTGVDGRWPCKRRQILYQSIFLHRLTSEGILKKNVPTNNDAETRSFNLDVAPHAISFFQNNRLY